MLQKLCSLKDNFLNQCEESYLPDELKNNLKLLIEERISILN